MLTKDFDYTLPEGLIAKVPTEKRSASRLLCLDKNTGKITHKIFSDLLETLEKGDLLVLNNTKVIPARVFAKKITGGKLELLLERVNHPEEALMHVKSNKKLKLPVEIIFENGVSATLVGRHENLFELKLSKGSDILQLLNDVGHVPLPPYFKRDATDIDKSRYQTVYAKHPGANAAPTAGLHFDEDLLDALKQKGVQVTFVTLHVGAGTFQPVKVEDVREHVMHHEYCDVSKETAEKILKTKALGKKVIAVGTTCVRTLETAAQLGEIKPFSGDTDLFIMPGFKFNCVDAIVTNFHLPRSTLLMLVSAFAGREKIQTTRFVDKSSRMKVKHF